MKKIIVIGSGIGGLTSANLLAQKGFSVSLYESHFMPGGYTGGFWRKSFYFESGTVALEDAGMLFNLLQDLGIREKISFEKQQIRWLSKEFDFYPETYEELKTALFQAYSSDEGVKSFFQKMDSFHKAFSGKNIWSKLLSVFYLLKYRKTSLESYVEKLCPKNGSFKNLSKGFCFDYSGAPLWFAGMFFSQIFQDYWVVKGGMQQLADTLAENFKNLGGNLFLNKAVEKIVTEKGTVSGVMTQKGFEQADAVIAACDYKETFLKLLDDRSQIDVEKIEKGKVSEGVFTVYLGLSVSNEQLKSFLKNFSVWFFEEGEEGKNFSLFSPSLVDPSLAPENKSSLMIHKSLPSKEAAYFSDPSTYKQRKKEFQEKMIQWASTIIPDLKQWIEFEDSATPLTYERFTRNAEGASAGWSWDVKQGFYEDFKRGHVETPIKNLYMGSAWACPIGGIPSAMWAGKASVEGIVRSFPKN